MCADSASRVQEEGQEDACEVINIKSARSLQLHVYILYCTYWGRNHTLSRIATCPLPGGGTRPPLGFLSQEVVRRTTYSCEVHRV